MNTRNERVDPWDTRGSDLWAVRQSGIESDQPIRLIVSPLMNRKHHKTTPGHYRLRPHRFDVALHVPGRKHPVAATIAPGQAASSKTFNVELSELGVMQVTLTPTEHKAQISGLVLEPIGE